MSVNNLSYSLSKLFDIYVIQKILDHKRQAKFVFGLCHFFRSGYMPLDSLILLIIWFWNYPLFSSPGPKGHVAHLDQRAMWAFVITFHIFIFFSETTEQIWTKLDRNVHWEVLYQICYFGADRKSNMAARADNVFWLVETLKIFLSETTQPMEL